jgi:hypothetical protein
LNVLKAHEFFDSIDWEKVKRKGYEPPYKPLQTTGTDNFDPNFLKESPVSANMSPSPQSGVAAFSGFTYKDPSLI